MYKTDSQWEPVTEHRELSSGFCGDLEQWVWGMEVGGRSKRKGMHVYIELNHFVYRRN